jgi:uncharacterized protein
VKPTPTLIRRFGRLRLAAILLTALPFLLLPVLGMLWLWQTQRQLYWLLALAGCALAGFGLHLLLARMERARIMACATRPDPLWPPSADAAWSAVERMAEQAMPQQWPLNDVEKLARLGRDTLEQVARHYHPHRDPPLLEMTVPHALLIIERAARDLRREVVGNIPFSHQLTIGTLMRANRMREITKTYEPWYRAGRAIVSPYSALFSELRRTLSGTIVGYGIDKLKIWLLQEYVRKVGYYAIALYSGQLLLDEATVPAGTTAAGVSPGADAEPPEAAQPFPDDPLRILLLGRANAGKSSLINALFGQLTTATDILPHTTRQIATHRLEREGRPLAEVIDAPGCDTELLDDKAFHKAVATADLVLWVTAAHRPDRQPERQQLDRMRALFADNPARRPPPILVVVTHIDLLRPAREWAPPYDLNNPQSPKARTIAAAITAIANDLSALPAHTIPVCLAPDRTYNVDDTLWAAILQHQDDAHRARFLRCLETRRRQENWSLTWRQLANAGRLLLETPKRILS